MFYWIYYIVCRIYIFVLDCEYSIILCKPFFNVQIHFDKNLENYCFLFRQHCDYLIVRVNIEFIYKIIIFVNHFFREKKMFFSLQKRNER